MTIPAGTATGYYLVLAIADANNNVAEATETNNLLYTTTRIGPDLTVSAMALPLTALAGSAITVTVTVKNVGGAPAPGTTTRFYLSSNTALDAGDTVIGSRPTPVIAPNATDAGPAGLTIPPSTAAGLYYIIAVTDADNVVVETAENNNTRAYAIRITVPM